MNQMTDPAPDAITDPIGRGAGVRENGRLWHRGGEHLLYPQPMLSIRMNDMPFFIDYTTARRCEEPISTAITESTVQWLLHRRITAQQQMRWSPRGAHLMLKVRTSAVNGTLDRDYAVAERWACRPFRRVA